MKTCEHCQTPLVQRDRETASRFATRRFCGTRCVNQWHVKERETQQIKTCLCGATFVRRPIESHQKFAKRRFCTPNCPAKRERQSQASSRKRSPTPPKVKEVLQGDTLRIGGLTTYRVEGRTVTIPKPRPGTKFEDPAQWLLHNKPTLLPARYVAPVRGAGK